MCAPRRLRNALRVLCLPSHACKSLPLPPISCCPAALALRPPPPGSLRLLPPHVSNRCPSHTAAVALLLLRARTGAGTRPTTTPWTARLLGQGRAWTCTVPTSGSTCTPGGWAPVPNSGGTCTPALMYTCNPVLVQPSTHVPQCSSATVLMHTCPGVLRREQSTCTPAQAPVLRSGEHWRRLHAPIAHTGLSICTREPSGAP